MNCDIFNTLYLRANGQFSCGCDTGHEINLGEASAAANWSVGSLFRGRGYSLARAMFRRGHAPWGEACARCICLQPGTPFAHDRPTRRLKQVLFEPSFACALRCPSCPRADLAPARPGPVFLSLAIWRRTVQSLHEEGYEVGLFLTTGLGDPLTHPRIEEMIEIIREFFPTTPVTINTNANYRFGRIFSRGVHPDRLLVSVDGLRQHSYAQYRINGDVETALDFMRDARQVSGPRPAVEWKYILFRHSDTDEELIAAQRKAAELDVDSLQFVFTHTVEKSLRYTRANVQDLPVIWSGTYPDATCHLRFSRTEARALTPNDSDAQPAFTGQRCVHARVDAVQLWSEQVQVRGWAMGKDGGAPRRLALQVNEGPLISARIGLVREDVWQAFPALGNRTAGFDAMLPARGVGDRIKLTLFHESADGTVHRFTVDYELGPCRPASTNGARRAKLTSE